MNPILLIPLILAVLFIGLWQLRQPPVLVGWNIAEGTHEEGVTKLTDAALTARFLLVKPGSDADHIAVNGAADKPLGVCTDEAAAAEEYVNVANLNATDETRKMVASEAIDAGEDIYTAASGKVQDEPASAGTYYRIGRARTAAGTDGDIIEVEPHAPVKVVVIAALGNANSEISALTFSSTPTQAEAEALRDKCEELADDVRAIGTALATPAEVKVLSA